MVDSMRLPPKEFRDLGRWNCWVLETWESVLDGKMGRTYFDYADLAFDLEFDVGVLVCHDVPSLPVCVLKRCKIVRRVLSMMTQMFVE